mmetsp:Transcript_3929/g.11762  ORF Transcript_3929/g.11762 Transcript_3929/m.11762 type:complete len:360 (+) Transcript_3929:121-1200(+)|eukprot:CAMPEP_0198727590 /NCGR_PEP_ID=MMETSP1475-20131203/4527_1 /TAXON_ID= ORGANISM="Unidentified sp., Strain CCMP1999" /NCGR_SAMPLE_ID=MMETSP1475 /ASSEMBLY_ACC=CAM_ASM_001111 /LENGTH=359 /DNA_ID=CAMNT_0044489649 /DNA_START=84 /DNA_END=1163 /DNA_ORIENTATION=-
MKALILVGGYGTRLRPLTLSKPKPLVEFCNKAMIMHQIEALVAVGVNEVVLAVNYQPQVMEDFLLKQGEKLGVKITTSKEDEPMDTAGPIKLAEKHLNDGEPFFVLNSDVCAAYPFKEMIDAHKEKGAEATILVTKVDDPSKFGVVIYDENRKIDRFVEKPKDFVGDRINAGVYLISPSVFDRIELRPTSIEKETFPAIAKDGKLYCFELEGHWADVGQPKDYLTGMSLQLAATAKKDNTCMAAGGNIIGNVLVDKSASVAETATLGPDVVIGPDCVVEEGARISSTALLPGSKVKSHAFLRKTIVGWSSSVGSWARTDNVTVFGEDVTVKEGICVNGARVLPHKSLKEDIYEAGSIVM